MFKVKINFKCPGTRLKFRRSFAMHLRMIGTLSFTRSFSSKSQQRWSFSKEQYFSKSSSGDSEQHNWSVRGSFGISWHQPCKEVTFSNLPGFVVKGQNISNQVVVWHFSSWHFLIVCRLWKAWESTSTFLWALPSIALLNWKTTIQGEDL